MHGAMGDPLCWYPLAHLLHSRPVTPSLQGHWPDVWLQILPEAPTGWQLHGSHALFALIASFAFRK
jgi:hypothetical protein